MKYGIIDFKLTVDYYWKNSWNKKALLNIGDASEYLVVEQILKKELGIDEKELVRIGIRELITYRGEYLIVPLNIAFDSYIGYNEILENLSPNIIPIFLGISLTNTNLNDKQLECLKQYAPIGCRDERTYLFLRSQNIRAYLNGCTASVIDINSFNDNINTQGKILFVDVPKKVVNYIPDDLKKDIVFLNQEIYCTKEKFFESYTFEKWIQNIFGAYKNAKIVVTSRFHGAVLALSRNIPCILTLEKYTFRFSWLTNYCNIYTEENFKDINWNVQLNNNDLELLKLLMKNIAKKRIEDTVKKYKDLLIITEIQKSKFSEEYNSSNQVLYYQDCIDDIQKKWNKEEDIEFGFWGINDNTEKILKFINLNYPKAHLVDVYDMFKKINYKGLVSKSPEHLMNRRNQKNYYVIVSAYLASRVAQDIFDKIGFNAEQAFLCKREFVNKEIL